jgi:hypothetical protein
MPSKETANAAEYNKKIPSFQEISAFKNGAGIPVIKNLPLF